MAGLTLQGGGLLLVFSSFAPIIIFIVLKPVSLHAPTYHLFAIVLFLVLTPNMFLHISLLRLALAGLFAFLWLQVDIVWPTMTS